MCLTFGDTAQTMRIELLHGLTQKQEVMDTAQKLLHETEYSQTSLVGNEKEESEMKKILSILLVMVILLTGLAGCGGGKAKGEGLSYRYLPRMSSARLWSRPEPW